MLNQCNSEFPGEASLDGALGVTVLFTVGCDRIGLCCSIYANHIT